MKKYFLVVCCAVVLFGLTGCGKKHEVTCSGSMSEGGINLKADVTAKLDDNDKVKTATAVYKFDDKKTAEQYCKLFKMFETADTGIKVTCSDTKITFEGFENMESEDNFAGMSKEDFIKTMEEEKFTCK